MRRTFFFLRLFLPLSAALAEFFADMFENPDFKSEACDRESKKIKKNLRKVIHRVIHWLLLHTEEKMLLSETVNVQGGKAILSRQWGRKREVF